MSSNLQKITIVGGCGHVGIPLGIALSSVGHQVCLLDINQAIVDQINGGHLPFVEEGAEPILQKVIGKTLTATTDQTQVGNRDVVFFVTGTPVDEHLNPRINDVIKVVRHYLPLMQKDTLVILRSTVYPGVVELIDTMVRDHFGSSRVAFCPERIVQGKGIKEILKLPQLVSATSAEAEDSAAQLFATVSPKVIRLQPKEAEVAKLITNAWRYLEFAIANQFYIMVEQQGLDFYKIYDALSDDYPRAAHYARPGLAAGPCLFKDTMQLSAFHKNSFALGHSAMLVNEGLPVFLVDQMEEKLGSLKDKKIALLGMTFKADNDDIRESLSYKLKKVLELKSAKVLVSDLYLPDTLPMDQAIQQADGVILAQPHTEYRDLKITKPFVDCWGVWRGAK